MQKPKVLVIAGPTSSGKTSLSISLAKKFDGEVISADSRQVYRGLDIGTGKVTEEEMDGVPHYLLDVADPKETYSVSDFVKDSEIALAQILGKKRLPIIAGGTFLYVDTLLGRMSTPEVPPNDKLRQKLEKKDTKTLFAMLLKSDPERAKNIDKDNPRRLIRALEIVDALGSVPKVKVIEKYDSLTLGIRISKEQLQENIHIRLEQRLEQGMIEEVKKLLESGLPRERFKELGIEYKYISEHLQKNIDMDEMKQEIETKSWQYAKRQMVWLKRNKEIKWVEPGDVELAEKLVEGFLEV